MKESDLLINSIKEGILMIDDEGIIRFLNKGAEDITGYTCGELTGSPFSRLYPLADNNFQGQYELSEAYKKGRKVSENWMVTKSDVKFWAETTFSTIYNDESTFMGYCCILRDVSERRKWENELRQSEERFRLMVEGVKDYSIFMLNTEGIILTWNEGAQRIKGYTPSEIIGRHFSIFYTAEDRKNKKPERELIIAAKAGKYEEESWRVKKNGSLFWANVVVTALFDATNKLIGFSKVTRDLTERKESEQRLRQSEERNRLLVEQVIDYGIFMLDEKGRIISWNEGARRIKGYSADEIIGKYFSIFYTEEDILKGKPAHELKVAKAEGKYEEEGWRVKKDGSLFWANVVITAIFNKEGVLLGFSKVTRDLTERKNAERQQKESYERYRLLADQLRVTNQELSYANEELEQFTAIVSHDLQEPVRTIRSYLKLLDIKLEAGPVAELKMYIAKAINSGNRMKELIQNVLQYSQLSRKELEKKEIQVDDLVKEALQNLNTSIESTKAHITVQNEVAMLYGDRVQLVQLIQNLLGNALKFTAGKKPEVLIKSTCEDDQVRFEITDNGIGIEEGNLNKVFEMFRRLHTGKEFPGTGIGLAICKKIVDRHQGKIWVVSQPGKGTTFFFTIGQ